VIVDQPAPRRTRVGPGSKPAANGLAQPMQACGTDPVGLENACDQTDRGSVVVHVPLAELACHAGSRGFESRRSRSESRRKRRLFSSLPAATSPHRVPYGTPDGTLGATRIDRRCCPDCLGSRLASWARPSSATGMRIGSSCSTSLSSCKSRVSTSATTRWHSHRGLADPGDLERDQRRSPPHKHRSPTLRPL
jgi:hypothetical protein